VAKSSTAAGRVANMVATRKAENSSLSSTYLVNTTAVENLGMFSSSMLNLLFDLGKRISVKSGDVESLYFI